MDETIELMEEQILEIIKDHKFPEFGDQKRAAKEITAHVKKFIKWIRKNDYPNNKKVYDIENIDNLYKYWLDNVKNK